MEIAFFGSSLVSAYWNGAATYYRGIIRAMAARGFDVVFYEPDAFERQSHRDMADPPWAKVVVYRADEAGVSGALKKARSADIVVKASGVGVYDEFLEREVLALQSSSRQVIYWDVDAPATLERIASDPEDPLRPLIPRFDLILTYGGGAPVVKGFESLGAKECIPIYNALDTATHFPVPVDPRFAADLAFLGNRLPDREARVEAFFLEAAARLPNKIFLLGGNGWGDKELTPNIRYLGHVYTAEHNALNCSALAVLNISRESMARFGFSPATRVFEAAGAGACLITDDWEGIDDFLEPGVEILVARDGEEVARHLSELTPERARAIGDAARRKVLSCHTYHHRAAQLGAILNEREGAIQ